MHESFLRPTRKVDEIGLTRVWRDGCNAVDHAADTLLTAEKKALMNAAEKRNLGISPVLSRVI